MVQRDEWKPAKYWQPNIPVIENSTAGWKSFQEKILLEAQNTFNDDIMGEEINESFFFGVCTCFDDRNSNLLDLQNFFIVADCFFYQYPQCELGLVILCNQSGDAARVMAYLRAQKISSQIDLSIVTTPLLRQYAVAEYLPKKVDGKIAEITSEIGKVFPLIKISDKENVMQTISFSRIAAYDNTFAQYGQSLLECVKQPSAPEGSNQMSQIELLFAAGKKQLYDIFGICKGFPKTNKSGVANKVSPINRKLLQLIIETLPKLSLLAQLIWLYSLRYGDVIALAKKEDTLHQSVLERSYWDAASYGDGVLQLLENCCQHTILKQGYFSMLIHDVNLSLNGGVEEAGRKRERIFRAYRQNNNEQFVPIDVNFYLEMQVSDCAIDNYGNPFGLCDKSTVASLQNLFHQRYEEALVNNKNEDSIDRILHHYGMPLFWRTILLNNGRFLCETPRIIVDTNTSMEYNVQITYKAALDVNKENSLRFQEDEVLVVFPHTEYRILLPMNAHRVNHAVQTRSSEELLDQNPLCAKGKEVFVRPSQYQRKWVDVEKILDGKMFANDLLTPLEKIELVQEISDKLSATYHGSGDTLNCNTTIFELDFSKQTTQQCELMSKGLYHSIASYQKNSIANVSLRFILFFKQDLQLCAFFKWCAIFYGQLGRNTWMRDVQLALCVQSSDEKFPPVIKTVLAGENLDVAYATVRNTAYYNAEDSLSIIPQIRYLTRLLNDKKKVSSGVPIFPFDLVRNRGEQKQVNNAFLQRVCTVLESDLQGSAIGCKLSDTHVQMGSKLHIKDFFEAELLFHNTGMISRFAYLLAEDILCRHLFNVDRKTKIVLVGYEQYSSVLMLQLKKMLSRHFCETYHMQYYKDESGKDRLVRVVEEFPEDALYFIVVPVGTTLSTIYKIRNLLQRTYNAENATKQYKSLAFTGHYALIVIGDDNKESAYSQYYWEVQESTKSTNETNQLMRLIRLKPEYSTDDTTIDVCNLILLHSTWHLPKECLETHKVPLCQVDKTSTLPTLIYPLKGVKVNGISFSKADDKRDNDSILDCLKGCVTYGHIAHENSHYQFYIDYQRFYENIKIYEEQKKKQWLQKWFEEGVTSIDPTALNIVVSPSASTIPCFVDDAVEKMFQHSLRFLYIPIHKTLREDMRARFSYMIEEAKSIANMNEPLKIHVYFVDYTITSAQSFHRSESLIKMLFRESGLLHFCDGPVFKKIFLLLNRSSYDTVGALVADPDKDFSAFATLVIPNFNTQDSTCPVCEQVELYHEIANSSSTNALYWYYRFCEEKHKKTTIYEYKEHQKQHLLDGNAHLQEYWQYCWLIESKEGRFELNPTLYMNELMGIANKKSICDEEIESILAKIPRNCIARMEPSDKNVYADFLQKAVLPLRIHRRLTATHAAVCVQESLFLEGWAVLKEEYGVNKAILEKILKKCETSPGQWEDLFEAREKLISYLKCFSRGYVVKIAPMRQGIYQVLIAMLCCLLNNSDKVEDVCVDGILRKDDIVRYLADDPQKSSLIHLEKVLALLAIPEQAPPCFYRQQYQIYLTLTKRLCDLQSDFIFRIDAFLRINDFLTMLRERHLTAVRELLFDSKSASEDACARRLGDVFPLPSRDEMLLHYIRNIKWATMSGTDTSKGFFAADLCTHLHQLEASACADKCLDNKELADAILLENTRMLYVGISRLNDMCKKDASWKQLKEEVRTYYERCKIAPNSVESAPEGLSNPFEGLLAQNMLMDFFRFYGHKENKSLEKEQLQEIAGILSLYRITSKLKNELELSREKNYVALYNGLCVAICRATNAVRCSLVHLRDEKPQILAQALVQSNVTLETIPEVLETIDVKKDSFYNIVQINEKRDALVVMLKLRRSAQVEYQQTICFVIQYESAKSLPQNEADNKYRWALPVLSMRQSIQSVLERDLYALHHFKLTYDDVKIVSKNASSNQNRLDVNVSAGLTQTAEKEMESICILHLTDLHINASNKSDVRSIIERHKSTLRGKNGVDLLVITGDIVQGHNTAGELEQNYQIAGEIIRYLAGLLWPQEENEVRGDWKKRIIIIPGNHDYAAMNELSAVQSMRMLNRGVPANATASPMVKFAYYVAFLHDLLDIDTTELLRDNLNEYRAYPELNLNILSLNTVAEVNALRTNKMQLDEGFSDRFVRQYPSLVKRTLPSNKTGKRFHLLLGHHTFLYQNDYVADRYCNSKLGLEFVVLLAEWVVLCLVYQISTESTNDLSGFKSKMCDIITKERVLTKSFVTDLMRLIDSSATKDNLIAQIQIFIETCRKTTIEGSYKKNFQGHRDADVIQDITYLSNHWKEYTNERVAQIINDYYHARKMEAIDYNHYQKRLQKIVDTFKPNMMLGGHRHEMVCNTDGTCYEGAQFSKRSKMGEVNAGHLYIEYHTNETKATYNYLASSVSARKETNQKIESCFKKLEKI